MTWNFDISTAPKGKMVATERQLKDDKVSVVEHFVPDPVWLATKCGKVLRSYWLPEAGKNPARWSGLATGEQPVAWQPFVVPAHPWSISDLSLNIVTKHSEVAA